MRQEPLRVLFVCGRGKWRSPTAARIYEREPGLACRARGFSTKSERTLSSRDVEWADVIFAMEKFHKVRLRGDFRDFVGDTPIEVLDIPDDFQFMDPELVAMIRARVDWYLESR